MNSLFITFGIIVLSMIICGIFLLNGKGLNLIAGYNTMSKNKKEMYDKRAFGRFTGWIIIAFSLCLAIVPFGIHFQNEVIVNIGIGIGIALILGSVIYMNTGKRFIKKNIPEMSENKNVNHSNKNTKITVIGVLVVVFVGSGIMFYQGSKDPIINIFDKNIEIKAMYGVTIDFSEITDILLIDKSMSEIGVGMRINGFGGIGKALKGHFRSDRAGETLLFVQYNSNPTIKIERKNDKDVYISFRDSEKTKVVYNEIISIHLTNIYKSGELDEESTCAIFALLGNDGMQQYHTKKL